MGVFRSTVVRTSLRVLRAIIRFVVTGYVAIFLGPSVLGYYALYRTVVLFESILTDAGVQHAAVRRISEGEEPNEFFTALVAITVVLLVAVCLLSLALGEIINDYLGRDLLLFVLLGLIAQTGVGIANSALTGENKIEALSVIEFSGKLINSCGQLGLILLLDMGLSALILGELVGFAFIIVAGYAVTDVRPSLPGADHFRRLFQFSRYAWITPISQRIRSKMDILILGLFVPASVVGVYELVWLLSSPFSYIAQALQTVLFPTISERSTSDESNQPLVGKAISYNWLFVLPGVFGAIALGPRLLSVVGTSYTGGFLALLLLLFGRSAMGVYDISFSYFYGINEPRTTFISSMLFILANLFGNLLLIAAFGISGAALATTISFSLAALYLITQERSVVEYIEYSFIGKSLLASTLMGLAVFGVAELLSPVVSDTSTVVLGIVAGVAIYSWIIVGLIPELQQKIKEIYASLSSKRLLSS